MTTATATTVDTDPDFNAYLSLCEELSTCLLYTSDAADE